LYKIVKHEKIVNDENKRGGPAKIVCVFIYKRSTGGGGQHNAPKFIITFL